MKLKLTFINFLKKSSAHYVLLRNIKEVFGSY
jgi:hypothetical protein